MNIENRQKWINLQSNILDTQKEIQKREYLEDKLREYELEEKKLLQELYKGGVIND